MMYIVSKGIQATVISVDVTWLLLTLLYLILPLVALVISQDVHALLMQNCTVIITTHGARCSMSVCIVIIVSML